MAVYGSINVVRAQYLKFGGLNMRAHVKRLNLIGWLLFNPKLVFLFRIGEATLVEFQFQNNRSHVLLPIFPENLKF